MGSPISADAQADGGQGRERPLETLRRGLASRNMLIVLDNFEQVLDAAPLVADLLQAAPDLRVLVTSRVVLRVRGEQEWRVDRFASPAREHPGGRAAEPARGAQLDRPRRAAIG